MPNPMDAILARIEHGNQQRKINALNDIFAKSYEPGATIPFVDEAAQAMGLPQEPGMVAGYQPGRFNEQNALAAMAQSKEPGFALQAYQLQLEMDARKAAQEQEKQKALRLATGNTMPMSVQETLWFMDPSRTPQEKAAHLALKRAQQVMNLGGTQAVLDPTTRQISQSFDVTPKPEQMPGFKRAQVEAETIGRGTGEQEVLLKEMEANIPRLEVVVKQLSDLGSKSTYTKAGQALDITRRQLGLDPREGSIARKEYISKVDNEVLPLLRQTFGAAFTQKEGESLKATLGDPDSAPAEKDAVLRSFIDTKRAQIKTQRRRLGLPTKEYAA